MISKGNVKRFCKDYKSIENYEQAINDNTQTWECHHRFETAVGLTPKQLKECGLYYDRPACELIFLTKSEHHRLHKSGEFHPMWGKHQSEEWKQKHSESMKGKFTGENNPMWGKHHSEESNRKRSESMKGKKNPMFGKHQSEESNRKRSESMRDKHRVYHSDGTWYMEKNIQ